MDRLSLGEKVLGASALALFLLSFAGFWIKVEADVVDFTVRGNAWEGYGILLKLGLFLALAAAVLVIARAANANLTLPWATVYKGLAGATLALIVIQFLIGPAEADGFQGVEVSRGIALFIGMLLAAVMAAGAWMHSEAPAASTTSTGVASA